MASPTALMRAASDSEGAPTMTTSVTEPPESDVRLKITSRPATAIALIASTMRNDLARNPSVSSRLATSHVDRSITSHDDRSGADRVEVVGLVRRSADEFEEHLGERAALEPEPVHRSGGPGRVEDRLRPLDRRLVAVGDLQPHEPVGRAEDAVSVRVEAGGPRRLAVVGHVDDEHGIVPGGEVVERALGDGAAAVDDDRVLAQVLDEVELVRREQHGGAAAGLRHEHLRQRVDGDGVEPGERLVEHEHRRLVDQ